MEADEFKYKVKRADEDADPGMIGDRVVSDIINADLVVADLTDLNPNAFYELGIRHSTEKPTIHIAKSGTALPFDNVAHRTIFVDLMDWQSTEQARSRLAESTRAIKAAGYKVSNPITQANASFKMRQSDDPKDRILADLQERLASIEANVVKAEPRKSLTAIERRQENTKDKIILFARQKKQEGNNEDKIIRLLKDLPISFFSEVPTEITLRNDVLSIVFGSSGYVTDISEQVERVGRISAS